MTQRVLFQAPAPAAVRAALIDAGQLYTESLRLALEGVAAGLKTDLRREVAGALGERASRALDVSVFPRDGRPSGRAAVAVWARGEAADRLLSGHAAGGIRRPRNARFLMIPLHRLRDGASRRLLTPAQVEDRFNQDLFFVPLPRARSAIGMMVLRNVVTSSRSGQLRQATRRRVARGDKRRARPMFLVVREVAVRKAIDPEAAMQRWLDLLPEMLDDAIAALERVT